jgi:hypothetical protein
MRKLLFSTMLAVICMQLSFSQNNDDKKVIVKPGISLGFGIFYPKEINDYIENDLSGYIATNENLYLNLFLRGSLGIHLAKFIALEPVAEVAIAPKIVIGAGNKSLIFGRVSSGVLADFYIPMGSGRNSFMLGGGALYHYMWFKDYSGSTIGPAIQAGISLNSGKSFNPEIFAGVNYAVAKGKYRGSLFDQPLYLPLELELSYTDFHIGVRFNFKM